jgi:hypothetical protein
VSAATKNKVLIFLVLSLISVLLLAASLSSLQLHAGTPFPGSYPSELDGEQRIANPIKDSFSLPLMRGLFAFIFLALMLYIPLRLLLRVELKKIRWLFMWLGLLLGILLLLPRIQPAETGSIAGGAAPVPPVLPTNYAVAPIGEPPQSFTWLVIALLAIAAGSVAFGFLRRSTRATPRDGIRLEASRAVDELNSGQDFEDVIIRCYLRMAGVLQEEQGIERARHLTVREFEAALQSRGIPEAPVHQLTALFEQVRYGGEAISETEQLRGAEALNQVIDYCEEQKASIA